MQAVQTQMQTNRNLYDGYVNDSDLIGTHSRLQQAYNLTDMMPGDWKDATNPGLDLPDFMGTSFTTGPDGKLYQLPDQQFGNLYWFRKDWFDREDLKTAFKAKYGYDLGVPVNWSAYEDIAEFFTNDVKEVDGVPIFGHMDYGKRAPDLGWRMTDAWLSMAGAGSPCEPNGVPIDEWGIRMEKGSCNPVGASVSRGGEANGPAAVYAIAKWDEWLRKYAPPGAASYDFLPSRSSGTPRLAPAWLGRSRKATTCWTTRATCCGAWPPARMAPTGKKARRLVIRTWVRGRSSNPRPPTAPWLPGFMPSSPCPKPSTSRKAMSV